MNHCTVDSIVSPIVRSGFSINDARAEIGLRASLESDREFLRAVYISTRAAEFSNAGWSAVQIDTLLAGQFAMQDAYYRRHYPRGCFDVVLLGALPVGRLYHDWSSSEARLIDIALLPEHRGAGIGTRLMQALVAEAARRAMPMRLYVESGNPVRSLYRRLGFVPAGENGVYEVMRRDAVRFDGEGAVPPLAGLIAAAA
ncbi:GNAT family N-acetyltransferase [Paraburkholderia phenazinium]|jgi:ribosomal protein S18 acetylase RimI-like enzyme|uniref:Ribosomal protein S18 acetylase RimI n=1 Tax=Paraburkholderia phenazinium TaxID=60549 RepID=A0A1G7U7I7_9BURK|nr:GNAT family N-acetyltransferase [Paraburkholderia phenazinium]SDG43377.1 Ribosomal protein S18 acetylase RimI [Paraburkholderia phenazinium]